MRNRLRSLLLGAVALAAALATAFPARAQVGFPFGSSLFASPARPASPLPASPQGMPQGLPQGMSLATPGWLCGQAIAAAERRVFLPPRLLDAIAHVESGRRDAATGRVAPWPWTVNAEGQGYFFETKAQAIAAVRDMQARGIRSIDVGCMQVNLMHHPDAFPSLDIAFDPGANAAWAARFLADLFAQSGSWPKATGLYHSATPELAADYQRKVQAAMAGGADAAGGMAAGGMAGGNWAASFSGAAPPEGGGGLVRVSQALLPPRQADALRVMLRPAGAPAGRDLAAYRAAPVGSAMRVWRVETGHAQPGG